MKYVTVIGSLNYDFFMNIDSEVRLGETKTSSKTTCSCGGKGANQAYQMGKLGLNVKFLGMVGNDLYGDLSVDSLKSVNVDTSNIETVENTTGLGFVTVYNSGDVSAIIEKGANHEVDVEYIKRNIQTILDSEYVILQMEIPIKVIEYIINICYNKVKIVLNAAPAIEISKELLKRVDYLIMNEVEACFYAKTDEISKENIIDYVNLFKEINSNNTIVTLGKDGSFLINDEVTYIPIKKSVAVDSTGAGDSYIGGFVYGLINGYSVENSCKLGAKSSAHTVSGFGREAMPYKL